MSRGSMESSTTQTVPRDLRRRSMRYGKQIKTNRDRLLLCGVVLLLAQPAWSQRAVFSGVQIRFSKSGKDRKLIESSGSLIFDDTVRKLIVKSSEKPLELGYDDVTQVVFDKTRHVREIKMPSGSIRPALLEISKDDSDRVMAKAQMLFGNNVHVTDFCELGKDIEKKTLKDPRAKHTVKRRQDQPPRPT